jgi:hypothetical protein
VTIIMNDLRRLPAVGPLSPESSAMAKADKVLVQPISTYHEGSEPKNAASEPYEATRSHAQELVSLGIAKIVGPPKPEDDEEEEGEEESEAEESETEQPDDDSDAQASVTPRRRGRPRRS